MFRPIRGHGIPWPRRHHRSTRFIQRCEPLEERLAFALFTAQTPLTFTGLNNNTQVAVSDFNKDGLADAALTNFGTDPFPGNSITLLYGRAGGGFNRVNLIAGGQNPSFISIADINADSWPDIVISNENRLNNSSGTLSVLRNDGAGNFVSVGPQFSSFNKTPSWVGLSDLTGDGILDAIVAGYGAGSVGNNITIFQGNADALGKGNFTFSSTPITTLAPGTAFTPTSLAIADFDADGLKDIAAAVPNANSTAPGAVYLFRGTGSAGFAAPTQYGSGGVSPLDIHAADLNGDSRPDLVIANEGDPNAFSPEFKGGAVGVLLNNSTPSNPSFNTTAQVSNVYGPSAVAVEDFNFDGKADIAAINYGSAINISPAAFVSVYLGTGTGSFFLASPPTYDTKTTVSGGQYLAVGDFDANGTPDLIVAHASNKVGLLLNNTLPSQHVTWTGAGDGVNWTDRTNWSGGFIPRAIDDVTISIAANPTIQITAGALPIRSLVSDENLTVAGGTLDIAQSSQITATLALSSGSISGTGDLTLSNPTNSWTGGTMSGTGKLIIASGATLSFSGPAGARSSTRGLQVDGQIRVSPGGAITPVFSNLEIGASGKLDLADNAMILDYTGPSPVPTLRADIARAYANGAWTGPGITSSLAAGTPNALGYAESTSIFSAFPANFAGQSVDDSAILIRLTRRGDLNLDGAVTISDFIDLSSHFNTSNATWRMGDLNYDGQVTISDFIDLSSNFNTTYSGQSFPAAPDAEIVSISATTDIAVPDTTKSHRPWKTTAQSISNSLQTRSSKPKRRHHKSK